MAPKKSKAQSNPRTGKLQGNKDNPAREPAKEPAKKVVRIVRVVRDKRMY